MKKPFIELRKVSKVYGESSDAHPTQILHTIDLTVDEGEFLILFGASGSGKSTILNILAGLEDPTEGEVMFHGRNLGHLRSEQLARFHRQRIGIVFQNFNLIKSLNCWENVALPLAAGGVRYAVRKRRALALMKRLHIDQYANRYPSEISGGEQQRLAICRALIGKPSLILADEPTGNLDSKTANEVMKIMKDIHDDSGVTIVMVTHNPDHLSYSTRYLNIQDGVVAWEERAKPLVIEPVAGEHRPEASAL